MGIAPEAMSAGEELRDLQGLSLNSSPVKASPSNQTRASSSDPAESVPGMPMFVESGDMDDVDDDDDEDGGRKGKKGQPNPGRRKIEIEYIEDKAGRQMLAHCRLVSATDLYATRVKDTSLSVNGKRAS